MKVDDPDDYDIRREEVARAPRRGRRSCSRTCRGCGILRAYAGVRPLYKPPRRAAGGADEPGDLAGPRRHRPRPRDGVDNFVSIVGGKLTTYRLMAEQTADVVVDEAGHRRAVHDGRRGPARPGRPARRTGWATGSPSTRHEGGGDADLHLRVRARDPADGSSVPRRALAVHASTTSGAGRGSGMGPCQGGVLHVPGRRGGRRAAGWRGRRRRRDRRHAGRARRDRGSRARRLPRASGSRARGPIAWGRQLQELWHDHRDLHAACSGWTRSPPPRRPHADAEERGRRCRRLTSSWSGRGWPA